MKITIKRQFLILFMIGAILPSLGQQKNKEKTLQFPMTEEYWAPVTKNVEFTTYKSVKAVKSNDDKGFGIVLKDYEFINGTIEFDVELKGQGFPGINFRTSKDTLNSEIFYLRHFGKPDPLRRTTMQYAAVIDGVNLWDLTDDYQAAATIHENKWNHIKLVVHGKQMKVFVNDMAQPALLVPSLEGITKSGGIGLSGNVIYANLTIKPNAVDTLPATKGYDPTYNDPNYLRSWQITEPKDFPFGKDLMLGIPVSPGVTIDPTYLDSTAIWKPVAAEYRSVVNLTHKFGATKNGERRLTWLKTTISSEKEQEKLLKLGFSDEVWVFINGQPLHVDKNYFGSPGMKEPRGRASLENTSFKIPFKSGTNELLIGITNYFFGWGIIARLENTEGLIYN
ncbi:family 16 glycoside hydrolase [Maribacter sp. 2210JD10-5]|uniref:family 16 glycoside hydrolase n=1 Tax=Maribacter sp. 2210JD10-5 TaxID=3386272 RepID=UPI0039BD4BCE